MYDIDKEYEIIETMMRTGGKLPSGYSTIGDDVAQLPPRRGRLAIKCDMLVAKTDVPAGMNLRQAARKSVAMCVSDFASKGIAPDSFLISLGLMRGTSKDQVDQLA